MNLLSGSALNRILQAIQAPPVLAAFRGYHRRHRYAKATDHIMLDRTASTTKSMNIRSGQLVVDERGVVFSWLEMETDGPGNNRKVLKPWAELAAGKAVKASLIELLKTVQDEYYAARATKLD